jgi:hypothetical protein
MSLFWTLFILAFEKEAKKTFDEKNVRVSYPMLSFLVRRGWQ